ADPIRQRLAIHQQQQQLQKGRLHQVEQWRLRLLEEGDSALAALLDEHPNLDAQQLRQLIRNSLHEKKAAKPPKAFRQLFKYLNNYLQ
ncbi:MAG: DUF615 domain-containing protein, partial [Gammaproteobacteria bacterium]|nr:DUF615 domain-containing protein [Gammaproteobacteria bacterium]